MPITFPTHGLLLGVLEKCLSLLFLALLLSNLLLPLLLLLLLLCLLLPRPELFTPLVLLPGRSQLRIVLLRRALALLSLLACLARFPLFLLDRALDLRPRRGREGGVSGKS